MKKLNTVDFMDFNDLVEIIRHEQEIDKIYKSKRNITINLFSNKKYYANNIIISINTEKTTVMCHIYSYNFQSMISNEFNMDKYTNAPYIALGIFQRLDGFNKNEESGITFNIQNITTILYEFLTLVEDFDYEDLFGYLKSLNHEKLRQLLNKYYKTNADLSYEELRLFGYRKLTLPDCKEAILNALKEV